MPDFHKNSPMRVELKANTSYWICKCGCSNTAPFCDGSHKQCKADPGPEHLVLQKTRQVAICACGKTQNGIYCDGSHRCEE